MKDKDREMAKAINAEFSDDDDEEDDNKSNWDDEEKVIQHYFELHIIYHLIMFVDLIQLPTLHTERCNV